MSTISSFKSIENRNVVCRGIDLVKKFCEFLREHAMELINFKKENMNSSANEQQKSHQKANICYISTGKSEDKHARDKKDGKARDHCHYTGE